MLIPFLPPANKFCGVSVFCLQVGLKVNVMCQCATARCSALLQIAPALTASVQAAGSWVCRDIAPASQHWVTAPLMDL